MKKICHFLLKKFQNFFISKSQNDVKINLVFSLDLEF